MQRIKSGTVSGSPRQPQQIYYDPSSPFLCDFQFYYCGTSPYFAATERYSLVCGEWCCESESYLSELFSEWDYFTIALSFAAWFNLIQQSLHIHVHIHIHIWVLGSFRCQNCFEICEGCHIWHSSDSMDTHAKVCCSIEYLSLIEFIY